MGRPNLGCPGRHRPHVARMPTMFKDVCQINGLGLLAWTWLYVKQYDIQNIQNWLQKNSQSTKP